ncbi:MAG: sulfatase [Actinomycetota bacterium]
MIGFLFLSGLVMGDRGRPVSDGPNIVMIVSDDQSWESIPRRPAVMPYLQSRLKDPSDHWIQFPNAFVNTALCCPSRATILSGQYAFRTGVLANGDGQRFRDRSTLATWLHDVGYYTGLFGKYMNRYPFEQQPFVPPGWDEWAAKMHGGIETVYFNYTLYGDGRQTYFGAEPQDYMTDVLAEQAVGFIEDAPGGRPFFLYYAPTAPHAPFVPPPRHEGAFWDAELDHPPSVAESDLEDKPQWVQDLPKVTDRRQDELDYQHRNAYETLLGVDDGVRRIMEALEAQGVLDETVVIYVSDNGYSFGEHSVLAKRCPYDECARVPLFVRMPGQAARDEDFVVSNADLAPTITALAGTNPGIRSDGLDVSTLVRGASPAPARPGVVIEWAGDAEIPAFWAYRTKRYLYTWYPTTGEEELYDLKQDPWALGNVVEEPDYEETRVRLSDLLGAAVPEWAVSRSVEGSAAAAASARNRTRN